MAESRKNCFALNLTPETHDQSFAMTSSFSNMYMATYLAFNLDRLDEITAKIDKVARQRQISWRTATPSYRRLWMNLILTASYI